MEKYLKRYPNLKLKAVWKIMKQDGIDVSYETLRRYVRELSYIYINSTWKKLNI